jgi:hypothetical protein
MVDNKPEQGGESAAQFTVKAEGPGIVTRGVKRTKRIGLGLKNAGAIVGTDFAAGVVEVMQIGSSKNAPGEVVFPTPKSTGR